MQLDRFLLPASRIILSFTCRVVCFNPESVKIFFKSGPPRLVSNINLLSFLQSTGFTQIQDDGFTSPALVHIPFYISGLSVLSRIRKVQDISSTKVLDPKYRSESNHYVLIDKRGELMIISYLSESNP